MRHARHGALSLLLVVTLGCDEGSDQVAASQEPGQEAPANESAPTTDPPPAPAPELGSAEEREAAIREAICGTPLPESTSEGPSPRDLQAFWCGERDVREHLSTEVGVLSLIAKLEAPPGEAREGGREVRRAERWCADELQRFADGFEDRFRLDLLNHVEGTESGESYIECADWECTLPAHTEWDTTEILVFAPDPELEMRLTTIVEVETLAVTESLAEERMSWASAQRRAHRRGRCD